MTTSRATPGRGIVARVTIAGETFMKGVQTPTEACEWIREQAAQHPLTRVVQREDGCHVAAACVQCPLAVCVLDSGGSFRSGRHALRDAEIAQLFASGMRVHAIATRYGIHRRSVFRILTAERRARVAEGTRARC